MSSADIESLVRGFCLAVRIDSKYKRFDRFFESLVQYNISMNIVDDNQWAQDTHNLTKGHFDPDTMTISVPENTYELACHQDQDSLSIMFHELGHLLLGHKPILHSSAKPPGQTEDAEWQADQFAEHVLTILGFNVRQLSFDFSE
ncbi:MAG: ImmA/IrrE family metallo-endopeptidase [Aeromonas sp.]